MARTKNPPRDPKRPIPRQGPLSLGNQRREREQRIVVPGNALLRQSLEETYEELQQLSRVNNTETRRLQLASRNQFEARDERLTVNPRPVGSIVETTEPLPVSGWKRKHWLKEIRVMQRSTSPGIPRPPFLRLSQEIMSCFNSSLRMSRDAAQALQDSAEAYLTGLFEDSNRCAVHAGRVTVQAKDMNLARVLGKHPDAREGQDFMSTEKVCKGARLGGVTPVRPIQRRRKRQVKGKRPQSRHQLRLQ